MSFSHWLSVAALALLPLAATAQQAQQAQQQLDPANANATVSASAYASAFTNYQAAAAEQAPPDKVWREANKEVQITDGHAGDMQIPAAGSGSAKPKADAHQAHGDHNSKGK